jgi:MYXO-CTERM domain-containing protein
VTITNAMITGDDAASFATVSNPTSSQVDSNSNATWLIVMTAETVGNKTATFEADYDGGSATVTLTGEPYVAGGDSGGDDGGTVDKSSYYACSTGRATTLWPIALALVFLARRRRRRN